MVRLIHFTLPVTLADDIGVVKPTTEPIGITETLAYLLEINAPAETIKPETKCDAVEGM